MSVFSLLSRTLRGMLESSREDPRHSLQDALARENFRRASSDSVYAVINTDGLLAWKDLTVHEVATVTDPAHGAVTMVSIVEARSGVAALSGFRPAVSGHLADQYLVNPVARHIRAALSVGAGQVTPSEELRGNFALCGVGPGGVAAGLNSRQQELIRVAHHAVLDASKVWSSYTITGNTGPTGARTVYLPGLHRNGMSADEARQSAERLRMVADSTDDMNSSALKRF